MGVIDGFLARSLRAYGILCFVSLPAVTAAESVRSVVDLEREARENVEKRLTVARVVKRLGVAWPPAKTLKTREEVTEAIQRGVERAAGVLTEE